MRHFGMMALVASALALTACGGGEKKEADTMSVKADTTPIPAAGASAATAAAAPITGTTHEVKMIGDATGYKFDPAAITIKAGDGIKYTVVSGAPHNVAVDPASVTDPAVKAQLMANMPNQASELTSPVLMKVGDTYTISFGNIKPGTYEVHCPLHLAMNMKQTVTVQ
jgi:plastocyanin